MSLTVIVIIPLFCLKKYMQFFQNFLWARSLNYCNLSRFMSICFMWTISAYSKMVSGVCEEKHLNPIRSTAVCLVHSGVTWYFITHQPVYPRLCLSNLVVVSSLRSKLFPQRSRIRDKLSKLLETCKNSLPSFKV